MGILKEKTKKKARNRLFFSFFFIIVGVVLFFLFNNDGNLLNVIKKPCQIKNASDVYTCEKENPYVEIHFEKAYDTSYVYQEGNKTLAHYVDIDLEDHGLIAIVKKDIAEKILKEEVFTLKGKLEHFSGVDKKAKDKIVKEYIDSFKEEYDEEYLNQVYLNIEVNSFKSDKFDNYIFLIVIAFFLGIGLYHFIKGILFLIKPECSKIYKDNKENELVINEEYEKEPIYTSKRARLTDQYLFCDRFLNFEIYPVKDILWMYLKITKNNGIETKSYILKDRKKREIILDKSDETIIEELKDRNPDILFGYTKENIEMYKEKIQEMKG